MERDWRRPEPKEHEKILADEKSKYKLRCWYLSGIILFFWFLFAMAILLSTEENAKSLYTKAAGFEPKKAPEFKLDEEDIIRQLYGNPPKEYNVHIAVPEDFDMSSLYFLQNSYNPEVTEFYKQVDYDLVEKTLDEERQAHEEKIAEADIAGKAARKPCIVEGVVGESLFFAVVLAWILYIFLSKRKTIKMIEKGAYWICISKVIQKERVRIRTYSRYYLTLLTPGNTREEVRVNYDTYYGTDYDKKVYIISPEDDVPGIYDSYDVSVL